MAACDSAQSIAEYALRQLGAPVVNIEVDDEQLTDCLDLAIQYYQEAHYDGVERDYIACPITRTKLTVVSSVGFAVDDVVTTSQGGAATIISITGNVIETSANQGIKFEATQTLTNGAASSVISSLVLGVVDTGYIELPDSIFSVVKVLKTPHTTSSQNMFFDVQYQIMAGQIHNLNAQGISYLYGTLSYLAELDYMFQKQKPFRFNRRMNRLYVDISWGADIREGEFLCLEVYRSLDPEVYTEVYNDRWLKKYFTALVKKQWGTNLSKYDGMTLPGGVVMNGKYILEQAMTEIATLEAEALDSGAPLNFVMG